MKNDPLDAPINDQIMLAIFEPMLDDFLEVILKTNGFEVKDTRGKSGYLIEFGRPGEARNTVIGATAKDALEDLIRNLTQLGFLPKEMREMQHQIAQQVNPIRDAINAQLADELGTLFHSTKKEELMSGREISPAIDISVAEWLEGAPPEINVLVSEIRRQKKTGTRPKPSSSLIDRSNILLAEQRELLLDKIAELVDENYCGRSEMCQQFASLLHKAFSHLGISSRIATGTCAYFDSQGLTLFKWPVDGHQWVCLGDEIVDGNLDCLSENPFIPPGLLAHPYWGPRKEAPRNRKYYENHGARAQPQDMDIEEIWWTELRTWLDQNFHRKPEDV